LFGKGKISQITAGAGNPLRDRTPANRRTIAATSLREWLLGKMIEHIPSSIDAASILQSTVAEVGQFLQTDRVLIYRCQDWASQLDGEEQKGAIVAGDGLR
jgi:light-regulated signal transduction histidine kinase (bacteriophytochrome)